MSKSPASSLTEALLARKGTAIPSHYVAPQVPLSAVPVAYALGAPASAPPRFAVPPTGVTVAHPLVHRTRPKTGRDGVDFHDRRRITLRLDPGRHVRLKLASAHLDRSIQDILIDALDDHLARVAPNVAEGGCACLAGESDAKEA
ncbi:MAG TPA: hypothetical protein VGB90_01565 [Alphaproteobacteria bacterium]